MATSARRQFTILDAMLLIAATAFGLSLLRWNAQNRAEESRTSLAVLGVLSLNAPDAVGTAVRYLHWACRWSGVVALPISLAVFSFGFTAGQDSWRTRLGQPGLAATSAATLAWALGRAHRWFDFALRSLTSVASPIRLPSPPFEPLIAEGTFGAPPVLDYSQVWFEFGGNRELREIGLAVVAVWLILALSKNWRPEPDWRDRLGRVVGFFWIGCSTLFVFADTLERYLK